MSIDRKNADVNHQDHPHRERAANNTLSIFEFDGGKKKEYTEAVSGQYDDNQMSKSTRCS